MKTQFLCVSWGAKEPPPRPGLVFHAELYLPRGLNKTSVSVGTDFPQRFTRGGHCHHGTSVVFRTNRPQVLHHFQRFLNPSTSCVVDALNVVCNAPSETVKVRLVDRQGGTPKVLQDDRCPSFSLPCWVDDLYPVGGRSSPLCQVLHKRLVRCRATAASGEDKGSSPRSCVGAKRVGEIGYRQLSASKPAFGHTWMHSAYLCQNDAHSPQKIPIRQIKTVYRSTPVQEVPSGTTSDYPRW